MHGWAIIVRVTYSSRTKSVMISCTSQPCFVGSNIDCRSSLRARSVSV
uniref:Uncharacterized protein n=1 Tax=Arundo donax TaxID=35708 RepID=A0A0A8ZS29_ARUDO